MNNESAPISQSERLRRSAPARSASAPALVGGAAAPAARCRSPTATTPAPSTRAANRKRVVVVGGGLAGLAAATELAARHFDVTLVERAAQLGGKLTAWTGARARRGVPGRARLPRLLRAVLQPARAARRRRRARRDLAPSPGYPVLFADRPAETFGRTTRLFPFNMLSVVRQSHALQARRLPPRRRRRSTSS